MQISGNANPRNTKIVSAAIVALFGMQICATAAAAETLQDVVQQALVTNPELGAIRFNRRAIDHELTASRGLELPTVDVRTDSGRLKDYNRTPTGITTGGERHWNREAQIVASQRLFDGFEARHEIARQKSRVESARWRVMDTANSIALRAVQAYLELRRAHSVLNTARGNLSSHQALLSRVSGRVSGGRGSSSDLSEAQARTAQAAALVAESEGRLRDADALFRAVVGRAPGKLTSAGMPSAPAPANIDEAVAEAIAFAPSVLATQHDATAAQAALGSAHSRFLPRVNLEVSAHRGFGMTSDGDREVDSRAMLVVRWNLLNGGVDKARIWEATARSMEAKEISANTKRIIERETRVSWNAILTAATRVPLLRRQVDQTRSTRASYNAQFDAGSRRLLDLLNVQSELFVAEASLRTEEFIRVYNSYRLLAAVGRLVPALGLEAPPEAVVPHAPTLIDGWRDGLRTPSTGVGYHLHGTTRTDEPLPVR
jgi:outer membrane protein, adhesin transport system